MAASTWIRRGPVSSPSTPIAYLAGGLIVVMAIAGAALGFSAAWRPGGDSDLGDRAHAGAAAGIVDARPIVDLANTASASAANDAASDKDDADSKDGGLAAQVAAAQADQAKPAGAKGDIDQINTPADEKPPPAVKAPAEEAPPNAPVKSDVPF